MTKSAFDQTPNLTETFDQVKRSSEIRSSDQTPLHVIKFETDKLSFQIKD